MAYLLAEKQIKQIFQSCIHHRSIFRLFNKQYVTHNEIAKGLKLKTNYVSNIMKKLEMLNLVSSYRYGRQKIYFLTSKGSDCLRFLNNNKDFEFGLIKLENNEIEVAIEELTKRVKKLSTRSTFASSPKQITAKIGKENQCAPVI